MISCIAAMTTNRCIGINNKLPFKVPADLKRFKKLTSGHDIIMGRKTWESLPVKPLPNRTNIVLSKSLKDDRCDVVNNINEAIDLSSDSFIIGGEQIYRLSLPYCDKIYLTVVDTIVDGDSFFPEIDNKIWKLENEEYDESNGYYLTYQTFIKS